VADFEGDLTTRNSQLATPFEKVLEAVGRGEAVALATVVRAPGGAGAKLVVGHGGEREGTTGEAALDAEVVSRGMEAITSGRTARIFWPHKDDPAFEVYVEPYAPPAEVVICGAGHIAIPLASMAKFAGFRVTVVDDRALYANATRFPTADTILAEPFEEALARTRITPLTAIVLITRGHKYDWDCLRAVIDSRAFYLGMIGSQRRVRAALLGLEREGVTADRLARVSAPIGLDIGSETPEEIAVAILAEIIMARRGGTGRPLSSRRQQKEVAHGA
jgi:xanthine dehydrogenase accessory factor